MRRGSMLRTMCPVADLQALAAAGCRVARYPLQMASEDIRKLDHQGYLTWVDAHLVHLETLRIAVPAMRFVIDLHMPPGGHMLRNGQRVDAMFFDTSLAWAKITFKQAWVNIASTFDCIDEIIGYDLLNEPGGTSSQVYSIQKNTVKLLREEGFTKPCLVSTPYGNPTKLEKLKPFPFPDVWYTAHMYHPMGITHQGLYEYPSGKVYPGHYTKADLRRHLQSLRDWSVANKTKVFIGEFSCCNIAAEGTRVAWLQDAIDLLNEYKWDFCVHCWREATVWDLESPIAVFTLLSNQWKRA